MSPDDLKLGPFDRVLLLGGGELLDSVARRVKELGIDVRVLYAPRHAEAILPSREQTLSDSLRDAGIETRMVPSVTDSGFTEDCSMTEGTFALSLGAAWIFPDAVIENIFGNRLFNLHGTRLPQNRGGGTFSWQILMGIRTGYCTLHRVDPGIDTGDIVLTEEFLYPANCRTPQDYKNVYREQNLRFITDFLLSARSAAISITPTPQQELFSSYWPRLNSEMHSWIDWSLEISLLERFICAFDDPYGGAQTMLGDDIVRLKGVSVDHSDGSFHPLQQGLVYRTNGRWLSVAASGGTLIVEQVEDEVGRDVLADISVGTRFVTPAERLDSRWNRVIYTPTGTKSD